MNSNGFDVILVGGGIVGLATAHALLERYPSLEVAILEKEDGVGRHQSGHNSGVIHSGIYYKPGSRKARLCVEGVRRMEAFCRQHDVRVEKPGKLIVATSEDELPRLQELFERGQANGVPGLEMVGADRLREIEPHAGGIRAIHSPNTGTVDYRQVCTALSRTLTARGVKLLTKSRLLSFEEVGDRLGLITRSGRIPTRGLINCAGLHADRVARLSGIDPGIRIVPFRGEYCLLRPSRQELVRGLIYPVPDPAFPFLGIHLTRTVDGEVEAGPNAVLAFSREGYRRTQIRVGDLFETLSYPGFWALARRYGRIGLGEMARSLSHRAFTRAARKLLPELEPSDLIPHGSGVRAQAVTRGGELVDDFRIQTTPHAIHVLNAPSPAATASLAIGEEIASLAGEALGLA